MMIITMMARGVGMLLLIMKRNGVFTLVFILLHFHPTAASDDVSFESEILLGKNGMVHGRFYMSGSLYRLEADRNGEPLSLLVDVKVGQTKILNTRHKFFSSVPTRTRQVLDLNPIEVFRLVSKFYTMESGGQETVNGLNCRKTAYLSGERPLMTAWFSKDISIPVKVVNDRFPEMNFELQHIRQGKIKPELLALPSDYQRVTGKPGQGTAPTEWVVKVDAPQTVTLEKGKPFKLVITDDKSDGRATRGQVIFIRDAPPPLNRFKAPFKLANGRSVDFGYPASDLVTAIKFHISQGGIHIIRVKPK